MALQKNIIAEVSVEINATDAVLAIMNEQRFKIESVLIKNAYIKVSTVSGSKEEVVANVDFLTGPDGTLLMSKTYSFTPDMFGTNFIQQGYGYLKTLTEFEGAADV